MVIKVRIVVNLTERSREKLLKVMKMFNVLIQMVVTWSYAYIKFTKLYI